MNKQYTQEQYINDLKARARYVNRKKGIKIDIDGREILYETASGFWSGIQFSQVNSSDKLLNAIDRIAPMRKNIKEVIMHFVKDGILTPGPRYSKIFDEP